ncbi:hypothetical protein BMS_2027 [Halobacteriovorax marinus SJ]|uniref:Uncharacterized protein n=1 Tax=Halobacteriovorax marinus (strain ATCC BAA-682 / DSM 15412 / SJ) TaxID=862908 RepID=E1X309_HALMS|nr:hypothetical protein [Halobacteriovorax marinus]CBW26839.1 hypothetical protein BMS_2027 [Halobacteriovorax marinus SJ]
MKKTLITFSIFILLVTLYRCRDFIYYTRMWITYEPKVFMGKMEPPFPNWFEVMWSLKGPDENKNGIRDDVEIYINNEFKDLNESELIMIYNAAVLVQSTLIYSSSEEYKKKYWHERNINIDCMSDYSSSTGDYDGKTKELYAIDGLVREVTRNTALRSNISRIFLDHFHMWSFELGGLQSLHHRLNTNRFCGFSDDGSRRIALEYLKRDLGNMKKYEIANYIKSYEDKYGKINRDLFDEFLSR